jgi:hypothetical protein
MKNTITVKDIRGRVKEMKRWHREQMRDKTNSKELNDHYRCCFTTYDDIELWIKNF